MASPFILRGRCYAYGIGLGLVTYLGIVGRRMVPRPFWVTGMALGDILRDFIWQVWCLMASPFVLRGRCGTYGTGLALRVRLGAVRLRPFCVAAA